MKKAHAWLFSAIVMVVGCSHDARPPTATEVRAATSTLEISRAGSRATTKGSPDAFVGDVKIDPLFATNEHRHAAAASVEFAPGARTAWHSHPAGQTLVVTAGIGWVQEWGGRKHVVKPGDVVWTPPGVKHWHGATASEAMTHIALQEAVGGKVVDWMEQVADEQYRAPVPTD
jgi:quercetin dioxygenase-like cupin family protein